MKQLIGITLTAMLVASGAMADITFSFTNGTGFDGPGVGATMLATDGTDSRTMETVDIIGADGSKATEGTNHITNIYATWNDLGIDDANNSTSQEERSFDIGEAWVFKFDDDVELVQLDLQGLSNAGGGQITISSSAFATMIFNEVDDPNETYNLGNVYVPAGVGVMLENTTALTASDPNWRLNEIVVAIPEPGTLGLLAASAGAIFMFRRRFVI